MHTLRNYSFKSFKHLRQRGMTLVELMVSIAISGTVLAGLVAALVTTKSNFVSQRELSGIQENARFAIKYMGDELRAAGYAGCTKNPVIAVNAVTGAPTSWYLNNPGLQGYEYDAGINTFPTQFKADVNANTDAIVVRRGDLTGLSVSSESGSTITVNAAHSYQIGQIFLAASSTCDRIAVFQMSGPTNGSNNATTVSHAATGTNTPGNCNAYYGSTGVTTCTSGTFTSTVFGGGSTLMTLHSEAYFVGTSTSDSTIPALYRDRLTYSGTAATTVEEELVQGVENMQILYGVDTQPAGNLDGLADQYYKANAVPSWANVVSVRISLRMRSLYPVYNSNTAYPVFEGVTGTDGSDRYMRQYAATTIRIRNY
ncbi:MAG TPA: PilW family protein [Candidatus Acidoferrum sp.]|nr:PilW family protein [Candidatus Acidoferrum sp.]